MLAQSSMELVSHAALHRSVVTVTAYEHLDMRTLAYGLAVRSINGYNNI